VEKALLISPLEALEVVASATGVYLAFLLLVRLFGQRSIARMSTFDIAIVLTLGSAAGRVITGYTPTLTAGVVALVTLFVLRWLAQQAARTRLGAALLRDRPVLLMAGGALLEETLGRARVTAEEVLEALRVAGVRNRDEVACVVLEATGAVSVTKRGAPLERGLFAGLRDAERIPAELFAAP
jgi:uncharacterized membrane protein YcaP (DUF421 family)